MQPSDASGERATLVRYLDAQRQHVLAAVDGLADDDLRRPMLPSRWTCLSLVQHLTLDVERFWFAGTIAGDQAVVDSIIAGPSNAWDVDPSKTGAEILAAYRNQAELSDAVIAAADLDAPPSWWPTELFGDWRLEDLRDVILHVVVETASHAGHLDAVRELIDGHQWLVLTD